MISEVSISGVQSFAPRGVGASLGASHLPDRPGLQTATPLETGWKPGGTRWNIWPCELRSPDASAEVDVGHTCARIAGVWDAWRCGRVRVPWPSSTLWRCGCMTRECKYYWYYYHYYQFVLLRLLVTIISTVIIIITSIITFTTITGIIITSISTIITITSITLGRASCASPCEGGQRAARLRPRQIVLYIIIIIIIITIIIIIIIIIIIVIVIVYYIIVLLILYVLYYSVSSTIHVYYIVFRVCSLAVAAALSSVVEPDFFDLGLLVDYYNYLTTTQLLHCLILDH